MDESTYSAGRDTQWQGHPLAGEMDQCSILGQQHNSGKMCDTCLRPASDAM